MSSGDGTTPPVSLYGYAPSRAAGFIFTLAFAVTSFLHVWQSAKSRAWWLIPTVVLASLAEVVGWVARTRSSWDEFDRTSFIIQTTVLVMAPTPLVAALFMGFGRISARLGAQYSRLSPRWYSRIFLTCDIISLFVQGGGGGIAASESSDPDKARLGSNIVLGGLIIQIISMSVFCFLMIEYAFRRTKDRPFHKVAYVEEAHQNPMDRHMKMLIFGIVISTMLIYIRSFYRVVEFADGFNGSIAHNQALFIVFDAVMVLLGLLNLNVCHPGLLLRATAETQTYALTGRAAY